MDKIQKSIRQLIITGHIEGVSYILLLFIAMPLKYMAGMPKAVSIVGMAHGVLFVAFIYTILHSMKVASIGFKKAVIAFILSLIPFGTFFLERLFRKTQS
jgi:integral membrane protein